MSAEDVFLERAERGSPRGADLVLARARATATQAPVQRPSEETELRPRAGLLLAAACVGLVAVGAVALWSFRANDGGRIDADIGNNSPSSTTASATNRSDETDSQGAADSTETEDDQSVSGEGDYSAADGHHVPLVALDDPEFRITGGYESAGNERLDSAPADDELSVFHDPELGFDGPYVVVRRTSERWQLDDGTAISINGLPALLVEDDMVVAVQLAVDGEEHLVLGFNLSAVDLEAIAASLGTATELDVPVGVQAMGSGVPSADGTTVSAEYNFELGDLSGDILVSSGGFHEFQTALLERWSDPDISDARSGSVDGHNAFLYDNGRQVALWSADGFIIEFRLGGASLDQLEALLPRISAVQPEAWEAVTPEDWIPAEGLLAAVESIVADSPLPDGTTIESLATGVTPTAPSVTAGLVASRVACGWISQWVETGESGNDAKAEEATAAMSTWSQLVSDRYPDSAWTAVFAQYAVAMAADGDVTGGVTLSVQDSYRDAFGCT